MQVHRASLPTPDCAVLIVSGRAVLVADHRVSSERVKTALALAQTALGLSNDGR